MKQSASVVDAEEFCCHYMMGSFKILVIFTTMAFGSPIYSYENGILPRAQPVNASISPIVLLPLPKQNAWRIDESKERIFDFSTPPRLEERSLDDMHEWISGAAKSVQHWGKDAGLSVHKWGKETGHHMGSLVEKLKDWLAKNGKKDG